MAELLRESLREVLYGPDGLTGLFSARGEGLLHTLHAYTAHQARTPPAPGRPTPAQLTMHLRHTLELTAAHLSDPSALLTDETDPWTWAPPGEHAWRVELMNVAQAGQALYGALYLPLSPEVRREAHGAVVFAATQAAVLRASYFIVQAAGEPPR
ncbi:DinB family protein [Deinococcus sp.]|uniref:DinB family protein n=1 Tax=Deinococcus sp. TaxID=47478 RepID=UPI002869DFA6|nr:DinB family protein [Deinococcus sp.]